MNSRTTKTTLIGITSILTTLITSIGALFVTQKILLCLGSDYNGVNATASQIVMVLGLIEGGFTLASQVALYKPVATGNQFEINKLLSYTGNKMKSIGIITLLVGVFVSILYSFFVKSGLGYFVVLGIILISVANAAFNIGIVSKYRLIFQVTQTEYICGYINILVNIILYIAVYIFLDYFDDPILVRLMYFAAELIRGLLTIILAKRRFKYANYNVDTTGVSIKGTREVFVSKITALIYNSAPVLFISTFINAATTSIYSVYLSITNIVLGILTSLANAPTHGIGQLISDNSTENRKRIISVYKEYELTVAIINSLLCSMTYVLLTPFIVLYTKNISDANYIDEFYTVVMVLIVMIQILHMPSGVCMSVAGRFKAIKNIQLFATTVLIVTMTVGVLTAGMKGLLIGKLITAIALSVCEIVYTYKFIIGSKFSLFLSVAMSSYIPMIFVSFIERRIIMNYLCIDAWHKWIGLSAVITITNIAIIFAINFVFNRTLVKKIIGRFTLLIKRT